MGAAIVVRDFRTDDQDEVRALVLEGLRERWGGLDETLNTDLDDMLASYGHGRVVVAELGGVLVGTGTLRPREGDAAEILRMAVAKGERRSGVGRRMVESLVATARRWGAARVVLETTSDWHDAVSFYLSCGFTITGHGHGRFGRVTWFEQRL